MDCQIQTRSVLKTPSTFARGYNDFLIILQVRNKVKLIISYYSVFKTLIIRGFIFHFVIHSYSFSKFGDSKVLYKRKKATDDNRF